MTLNKESSTLFVGNLGFELNLSQFKVREIFATIGIIPIYVNVLTDRGVTKGAAFVDLNSIDEARRAI